LNKELKSRFVFNLVDNVGLIIFALIIAYALVNFGKYTPKTPPAPPAEIHILAQSATIES
jgi:hypothetical protein